MHLKLYQRYYFFLVLFYLIFLPLYSPYFLANFLLALLLAALPIKRFIFFLDYLEDRKERYFLSRIFTFISNELSAGQSLYHAFQKSITYFSKVYAASKKISQFLFHLKQIFSSALPLEDLMLQITQENWLQEEHQQFFKLIAEQVREKNPLFLFFKQSSQLLQKRIALEEQIQQDQSKQQTEAILLLILPYVIAFVLKKSFPDYLQPAFKTFSAQLYLFLAFILNQIALLVCTFLFIPQAPKLNSTKKRESFFAAYLQRWAKLFLSSPQNLQKFLKYFKCLPLYLWENQIHFIEAFEKKCSLLETKPQAFLAQKLFILCAETVFLSVVCLILCLTFYQPFFLILIPLYLFIKSKQLFKIKKIYLLALEKEFALYFHFVFLLLKSAYTPRVAMEKALFILSPQNLLYREIYSVLHSQEALEQFEQRFNHWSSLFPPNAIQVSLNVLQQYIQYGHPDMLNLLEIQLKEIWKLSQNAYKKEAEQRQLYLFLPMLISLISIFLYFLAPALASFTQLN